MVRAKFRCEKIEQTGDTKSVVMVPVISGSEENERFFKFTPGGYIGLSVINEEAASQFEIGQEYYVDFSKA